MKLLNDHESDQQFYERLVRTASTVEPRAVDCRLCGGDGLVLAPVRNIGRQATGIGSRPEQVPLYFTTFAAVPV